MALCDDLSSFDLAGLKAATAYECATCVTMGGEWVNLRTCQTCGITLCCDNSPNQHATNHAREHDHPIISSAEPGDSWVYCYRHEMIAEYGSD